MIAAPMFHSWGFAHFTLALPLASTLVLRRKFDPEETLRAVAEHGASALAVVPVMLQRMLELAPETIARYDAQLPARHRRQRIGAAGRACDQRAMDAFGDVLYNLYGSTEVAWATIATPADLRAAPGTAGHAAAGHRRQAARRATGARCRRARPAASSWQRDGLRRLHRRRQQGDRRRADEHRRRRAASTRRAACSSRAATTR